MQSIKNIISRAIELRLDRAVVVYLGTAWVMLEAFGFFGQRYQWPSYLFDVLLVLFISGLPAFVIVLWLKGGSRRDVVVGISLVGVILLIAAGVIYSIREPSVEVASDKSVAVIPFKNLSLNSETEYFADGMRDDIFNRLSKVHALRIISGVSVEKYRDTKMTSAEIGKELGVSYILEGSAQRDSDRIRIIAHLISVETNNQIWSENYTRALEEVFTVQSDIATNISRSLEAVLTEKETRLINLPTAENLVAYDLYLRGNEYLRKFTMHGGDERREESWLAQAKNAYKSALRLDPGFAEAWCGLAREYRFRNAYSKEFLEKNYMDSVLFFSSKAIALNPNLAEAYAIRGRYFRTVNDFDKALEDERTAIEIDPNNPTAYRELAAILIQMRDYLNAYKNFQKVLALVRGGDDLPTLLTDMGDQIFLSVGDFKAADSTFELALKLKPDFDMALIELSWSSCLQGKFDKALDVTLQLYARDSTANGLLAGAYSLKGDFDNALKYWNKARPAAGDFGYDDVKSTHRDGYILWNSGNRELGEKFLRTQINTLEKAVLAGREDAIIHYDLAGSYAFLGDTKTALKHVQTSATLGFHGGLEFWILHDPLFKNLWANKEFKQIVNGAQAKKAAVRAQIRAL